MQFTQNLTASASHAGLTVATLAAVVAALPAQPAPPVPIPPRTVTIGKPGTLGDVVKALADQTGIAVDTAGLDPAAPCPLTLDRAPFWAAVDRTAAAAGAKVTINQRGRRVTLAKRTGPPQPAAVDGPFRVAVRAVNPRLDFDTGAADTEVTLDVAWEPRVPVFLIDSEPAITALAADAGTPAAAPSRVRTAPTGSPFTTTVRVTGVPRAATKLTRLAGAFTVTAAPAMLPFVFADLAGPFPVAGKLPAGVPGGGVTASLKRFEQAGDLWEADVEVLYPAAGPAFESFESWVTENRARLVGPDAKPIDPADFEHGAPNGTVAGTYRFKARPGDRKGWSLEYVTPAPLVEFPVRFALSDVPLP